MGRRESAMANYPSLNPMRVAGWNRRPKNFKRLVPNRGLSVSRVPSDCE